MCCIYRGGQGEGVRVSERGRELRGREVDLMCFESFSCSREKEREREREREKKEREKKE